MTKMPVCKGSAKRRQSVGQLGLALGAVLLGATAAQAGIWEEFEARCLVPLENVELSQPSDLVPSSRYKNDGDTYSKYRLDGGSVLAISDGRNGQKKWCQLSELNDAQMRAAIERFTPFVEAQLALGRYKKLASSHPALVLQSVEWREPVLEIRADLSPESASRFIRVEETDLES